MADNDYGYDEPILITGKLDWAEALRQNPGTPTDELYECFPADAIEEVLSEQIEARLSDGPGDETGCTGLGES